MIVLFNSRRLRLIELKNCGGSILSLRGVVGLGIDDRENLPVEREDALVVLSDEVDRNGSAIVV